MKIAFYSDHLFPIYYNTDLVFSQELQKICGTCRLYRNPQTPKPGDYDALLIGQLHQKHGSSKWLKVCNSFGAAAKPITIINQSNCYDRYPFYDLPVEVCKHITAALPPGILRSLPPSLRYKFKSLEFPSIYFGKSNKLLSLTKEQYFKKHNLTPSRKLLCVFADRSDRISYSPRSAQYLSFYSKTLPVFIETLKELGYQCIFKLHRQEFYPKTQNNTPFKEKSLLDILKDHKIPIASEKHSHELLTYSDFGLAFPTTMVGSLYHFNLPLIAIDYQLVYEIHASTYPYHHPTTPPDNNPFNFNDLCLGVDHPIEDINANTRSILKGRLNSSIDYDKFSNGHYVWGNSYNNKMSELASLLYSQLFK